ncbi:cell wall biogenesis protein Mhp1 [Xylariales sp. AK1849]|nr:cell wall biogenesis protein Mhp1 [Xylariales sp. AK1849]
MEQIIDVSWMDHGKDKCSKQFTKSNSLPTHKHPAESQPLESTTPSKVNGKTAPVSPPPSPPPPTTTPAANSVPSSRPGFSRHNSIEEKKSPGPLGTPPQRRGSWFSKISAPFSLTPSHVQQGPTSPASTEPESDDVSPLPKITPNKNAVLPHGSRQPGDAPYVPAPPRSGQPGFLQVFRRKSSSNGSIVPGKNNHGLVERRVLNVDKKRQRPRVSDLNQAKLRRVAFCVDVEIAPMPKYSDSDSIEAKPEDKTQKRKIAEKGEGEALKRPKAIEEEKETAGVVKATGEALPEEPAKEGIDGVNGANQPNGQRKEKSTTPSEEPKSDKEMTRKKEKKRKSEAERKAKKEQKRKEAVEKGAIPMEIHFDSDSSAEDAAAPKMAKPHITPTTNAGRIYRRCCQLRETDILTKVTSQLPKSTDRCPDGIVEKLDLTGYLMSLADLVTLGDFLAVVPVKEIILENCGLTDEGVRVVLAGLLASKKPKGSHRRPVTKPADLCHQGGVVERLVLRNNKLGSDGWKHICLFIHMCHSLKCLDLSNIPFPAPSDPVKTPLTQKHYLQPHNNHIPSTPLDLSLLLSRALSERLSGSELELLNMSETGITTNQLSAVIDGCLGAGISRLGLAHNDIDAQGIQHVARYLRGGRCQGLDLGGNDLRDHLQLIADAITENDVLWALSLANSNLKPSSLCKLFPKLTQLKCFKFIDLSHNHELCESEPSAISLLRRYLPKLDSLKRLHLADVAMSSEQAIAIAEILPEISTLAHINILENPQLVALADAKTEETQEEACALYASLLAAARVSETLVKIDIDNPSAQSGEIVKALANQALAYCLRNMRMAPDLHIPGEHVPEPVKYPDVLRHIVGHEEDSEVVELSDDEASIAPDEDYVIGGTGVVKALKCCLDNLGQDSRRQSGEFVKDLESGAIATVAPRSKVAAGKAKDMSKHLLASARKIRVRLQPALAQAKASSKQDMANYNRLVFLDQTLQGIINRFEDEFPETRRFPVAVPGHSPPAVPELGTSLSSTEAEPVFLSDAECFETELRSGSCSRSNSIMSHTSKALAEEEGRALRIGHKFRRGFIRAHYDLLMSSEEIGNDPDQRRQMEHLLEDLGAESEDIRRKVEEKGPIVTFQEDKEEITQILRDRDPVLWDRFIESQEKARANLQVGTKEEGPKTSNAADESAIAD